jgi:hypothetical protein
LLAASGRRSHMINKGYRVMVDIEGMEWPFDNEVYGSIGEALDVIYEGQIRCCGWVEEVDDL